MLKKITALIVLITAIGLFSQTAFAQGTALPEPSDGTEQKCDQYLKNIETGIANKTKTITELMKKPTGRGDILGCAIKTGRIHMWMVPYFITYLIEVLIAIAGAVCMLFIVIGGYFYVIGGISEDKEKGKKTILYALIGLIIALTAWIVINIIQVQITS